MFEQYTNRFILANRTRVHFIETEAMQYIQQAAEKFDLGSMFVSFSGGKDSTVVSDLVTRALGRADVLHIFGNTTLEFPQTIQYVEDFRKLHPTTPMLRAENERLPPISIPSLPGDLLFPLHRLGRHEGHAISRGL